MPVPPSAAAEDAAGRPAAALPEAEALVLHCIDYRLADAVSRYLRGRGLEGRYDVVALAGAALSARTPEHPEWAATFWGMLDVAIRLHGIRRVLLLDHRDCGAYRLAGAVTSATDQQAETAAHAVHLRALGAAIRRRHPRLAVERLLMALDGGVEAVG